MKLVGFFILALLANDALACRATPAEQHTPPDELIARTQDIVLAKVVRADAASNGWNVLYTFKTIRQIKGENRSPFQILGRPATGEMVNWTFNEHFDPSFWEHRSGRTFHDTSCKIRPGFVVGGEYLVFLDQPYHTKSFEMILMTEGTSDTRDKWLQYVEQRAGP